MEGHILRISLIAAPNQAGLVAIVEDVVVRGNVVKVFDIEFPIAIALILFISQIPMVESTVEATMMKPEIMKIHIRVASALERASILDIVFKEEIADFDRIAFAPGKAPLL